MLPCFRGLSVISDCYLTGPFSHGFSTAYSVDMIGTGTPCFCGAAHGGALQRLDLDALALLEIDQQRRPRRRRDVGPCTPSSVSKRFAEIVTPSAFAIAAISRDAA